MSYPEIRNAYNTIIESKVNPYHSLFRLHTYHSLSVHSKLYFSNKVLVTYLLNPKNEWLISSIFLNKGIICSVIMKFNKFIHKAYFRKHMIYSRQWKGMIALIVNNILFTKKNVYRNYGMLVRCCKLIYEEIKIFEYK